MKRLALVFLALAIPASSHAQSTEVFAAPELSTFSYGIICYHLPGAPGRFLTPRELEGMDVANRVPVTFETRVVPAIPTIHFGVVIGLSEGERREAVSTITLTPIAAETVEDVIDMVITDVPQDDAWRIDELTAYTVGTYRFHTVVDAGTLYDVTFNVVPSENYSGPLPPCIAAP